MQKKYFLVFHTVFVLDENIDYLEEFLLYHLNLGVEHFYLYDNSGSIGRNGSTQNKNKYGFDIIPKDNKKINFIQKKYGKYITYIKWNPRNVKGDIIYGYNESVFDFIKNYKSESEWCAFLDLDEFIYSSNNINIVEYLKKLKGNIGQVRLVQKKFKDRHLIKNKLITQDFECIEGVDIGLEWASKSIIKTSKLVIVYSVHKILVKNKTILADVSSFRFNHYNVNDKLLKWMKNFYKSDIEFKLNGKDDGMNRYYNIFKNMGSLDDSFKSNLKDIKYDRICDEPVESYLPKKTFSFMLRILFFRVRRKIEKAINKIMTGKSY